MKYNNTKFGSIFSKHFQYILTLVITYLLGALVCTLTYIVKYKDSNVSSIEIMQLILDFFMPTTFTYLLCSGFSKIYESIDRTNEIWSWIVLVYSIVYIFSYLIYQLLSGSGFMIVVAVVLTILGLFFDLLSYKEKKLNMDNVLSA